MSSTLQKAGVNVLTPANCKQYWGENRIDEGMICVFDEGVAGACNVSNIFMYCDQFELST